MVWISPIVCRELALHLMNHLRWRTDYYSPLHYPLFLRSVAIKGTKLRLRTPYVPTQIFVVASQPHPILYNILHCPEKKNPQGWLVHTICIRSVTSDGLLKLKYTAERNGF